ncbi:hypothetical protein D3C80_1341630 [compost metagenome]
MMDTALFGDIGSVSLPHKLYFNGFLPRKGQKSEAQLILYLTNSMQMLKSNNTFIKLDRILQCSHLNAYMLNFGNRHNYEPLLSKICEFIFFSIAIR